MRVVTDSFEPTPPTGVFRMPGGRALSGDPVDGQRLLIEIAARGSLKLAQASRLELEHNADDHFDRLVSCCRRAEREICMEMYQIRRDPVGHRIVTALADAAGRSVPVRLLVDPMGSSRIGDWLPTLRGCGVDVRWYSPWRPWNHPLRRTHRKLFIVDGRIASVGGINLAGDFSERLCGSRAWRDVGLWTRGPVVSVLRQQFEAAWTGEGGGAAGPMLEVARGSDALVAVAGGRDGRHGHGSAYIAIADSAREELLLATPYFIPDRPFREALKRAARRGVRVVVVIPRLCDIAWFKHAGRRLYSGLLSAGVEIWERHDRMVHAKVGVVDGRVAAIGSVNLNRRSFHGNAETLVLTSQSNAVTEIHDLIAIEAAHAAEPLTPLRWSGHPDRRRFAELASAPLGLVF
jgi:cardiolipin synthase